MGNCNKDATLVDSEEVEYSSENKSDGDQE